MVANKQVNIDILFGYDFDAAMLELDKLLCELRKHHNKKYITAWMHTESGEIKACAYGDDGHDGYTDSQIFVEENDDKEE